MEPPVASDADWRIPLFTRTLSLTYHKPWLLGWCRWEISTTIQWTDRPVAQRSVLASGRWRWRGRDARYREVIFDADSYFREDL